MSYYNETELLSPWRLIESVRLYESQTTELLPSERIGGSQDRLDFQTVRSPLLIG